MKVGILIVSKQFAGAEHFVYELSKNLITYDYEVNLFVNEEIASNYRNIKKLKVINLGALYSKNIILQPYYFFKIIKKLNKRIKQNNIKLIHLNLESSMVLYSFLSKFSSIKSIITLHGTEVLTASGNVKGIYKKLVSVVLNNTLKKSKLIISPSNWQIISLKNKYDNKIVIIPNLINLEKFKKLNVTREKNVVLFVGRYEELKGINELIKVSNELPQYEFWFAGQGPLKNIIKGENVKDLGFKDQKELVKLYNKATICTFPSHHENFPGVGLEAMACGTPVIATPLGFSEYIENGKDGIIIRAKDEKAIKEAIVNLMQDKKLRDKLGKNARKKVLLYNPINIVKKYLNIYKKVLKENETKHK